MVDNVYKGMLVEACAGCSSELIGQRYIFHERQPFCVVCYERKFSNTCSKCKSLIGAEVTDILYKDKHWHDYCFTCDDCKTSLVEQQFAEINGALFCVGCYGFKDLSRCVACQERFKLGATKYDFNNKHWHQECFACKECGILIGTRPFIPIDDQPVCIPCHERLHMEKCDNCSGLIKQGGVMCRGKAWHRECFQCAHCHAGLSEGHFAFNGDKQYCMDCYTRLFAKMCFMCQQYIGGGAGIGASSGDEKFVSFDKRAWHCHCFTCHACSKDLVGKGFLFQDNKIFCNDCAK